MLSADAAEPEGTISDIRELIEITVPVTEPGLGEPPPQEARKHHPPTGTRVQVAGMHYQQERK